MVEKLLFSSDQLPHDLDERARFTRWRELFVEMNGSFDLAPLDNERFSVRFDTAAIGELAVCRFEGTVSRLARTHQQARTSPHDMATFCINLTPAPMACSQRGRDLVVQPGAAALMSNTEGGAVTANTANAWYTVYLPNAQLRRLSANAEDMIARPFDPANPAVRHLRRYLDLLIGRDGVDVDASLYDHVDRTLADLVALALGSQGEAAEVARMRGLRAARLQQVLAAIRSDFDKPACSPDRVARKLGLSPRYIQDLLQEVGTSFTARVLELRLQKAHGMLVSSRYRAVGIAEIAEACGFNEVSYFNRCFRRRFGAAPGHVRTAAGR